MLLSTQKEIKLVMCHNRTINSINGSRRIFFPTTFLVFHLVDTIKNFVLSAFYHFLGKKKQVAVFLGLECFMVSKRMRHLDLFTENNTLARAWEYVLGLDGFHTLREQKEEPDPQHSLWGTEWSMDQARSAEAPFLWHCHCLLGLSWISSISLAKLWEQKMIDENCGVSISQTQEEFASLCIHISSLTCNFRKHFPSWERWGGQEIEWHSGD